MNRKSDRIEEPDPLTARLGLLVPLNNLAPQQREQVVASAETLDIRKKDYVFRQGDRDNYSFYVLDGEVELYADDQLIKHVVGGEAASFQALSQLQPRQMSARAKTRVKVLKVDRGLVERLLSVEKTTASSAPAFEVQELAASDTGDWLTEMLQSELFAHVPPSNIQRLLETLESVEFKAGDTVIEQDAPGDYYYAVQSGRCEVLRVANNNKPIKLAELGPGARFGEEALVSNAKRNATVRMVTDGELARLTKEDFVELIKTPVLNTVSLDEARALVAGGAKWLDVRFPEECAANGLENCLNVPLSNLRMALQDFDRDVHYVAYCGSGGRSSAAAFLLTQEGFNVCYVEGGAIDEVPKAAPASAGRKPAGPAKTGASTPRPAAPGRTEDDIVEADIRAQSLAADLEKAKLQIEQAQRLMAEANAAKAQADRLVAEKLRAERAKIAAEAEAVAARMAAADRLVADKLQAERAKIDEQSAAVAARMAEADRLVEERLRLEREKIEAESATVAARLAEAERLKKEIERKKSSAEAEAERRHREQEERNAALRAAAEQRLQEEKARIDALYREQAEKLEELERTRERSAAELEAAWAELRTESNLTQERLEAAQELETELRRKERERARELADNEQRMRTALQAELEAERKKLEAEFANTAEEIERARRAQQAAEAAKKAAAAEAQRIIEEYKQAQATLQAEQTAKLLAERKQIEADAARLKSELEQAATARAEAEAIKREAEAQLAETRARHASVDAGEIALRREIEAIEERARAATERLRTAVVAEDNAVRVVQESEERLERTYGTEREINMLLQKELEDWVAEQERLQASTARRHELEKQLRQTERIKVRAVQAQHESATHDANLLDEIAAQLGESS